MEKIYWAYTFDENGYYCGRSRRQESPLEPGVFLTPRNSTHIVPPFKEGFKARWNGLDWDLEKIETAKLVEKSIPKSFPAILEERQDELISQIRKSVMDICVVDLTREIRVSLQHELNLCREQFLQDAFTFKEALNKIVDDRKKELLNLFENGIVDFESKKEEIEKRKQEIILDIEKRKNDFLDKKVDSSLAVKQESKGLLGKLFS